MRVLSIDLDYCMFPCIERYQQDVPNGRHPVMAWMRFFHDIDDVKESELLIDKESLHDCYNVFSKALQHCDNVGFAYDHDGILYELENKSDIEIINFDYHGDVVNLSEFSFIIDEDEKQFNPKEFAAYVEFSAIRKYNNVMEGNWVAWLKENNKLKNYTWITSNKDSIFPENKEFSYEYLDGNFDVKLREQYEFSDYKFDYIFVCLSPLYVPPKYWGYFKLFVDTAKKITGKQPNIINQKYEFEAISRAMNKYIGIMP